MNMARVIKRYPHYNTLAVVDEVEERSKMKWNRINERMNIFSDDVFSEYDFWV